MNHQQLVALSPELTPYKRGLGNGLSILVDPKGAKYFTGRIKGQSVWVGTFETKNQSYLLRMRVKNSMQLKNIAMKIKLPIPNTKERRTKPNQKHGF